MAIPILMYHNVAGVPAALHPDGRCLYVTPDAFAAQMGLLHRLGWRGVTMSEAMPYLRGEKRGRVAAITFDDPAGACEDAMRTAWPRELDEPGVPNLSGERS